MVTQINNYMFLNYVILFIIFWTCLSLFSLFLVVLRRDYISVLEDLLNFVVKKNLFLNLFSILMIWFILPFSIPYSIAHFLKK